MKNCGGKAVGSMKTDLVLNMCTGRRFRAVRYATDQRQANEGQGGAGLFRSEDSGINQMVAAVLRRVWRLLPTVEDRGGQHRRRPERNGPEEGAECGRERLAESGLRWKEMGIWTLERRGGESRLLVPIFPNHPLAFP